MATIAELMVKIDANNRGLTSAIKQSESRVKKFAKSVKKTLTAAFKVGLAAAAVGLAAITAGLVSAAKEVDKLAKTARKLGAPIAALQEMQLQAELSGVSTEKLNMGLQRMVRRVSAAAKGTGEAVDALKELGLDAKYLSQLRVDRQFQQIGLAMKMVANQGDRIRIGQKIFDSEAVDLVNTFASNTRAVSKEFRELGLGITESQARSVEAFNDSGTKIKAVFDSIKAKSMAALAPVFQGLLDDTAKWIKSMGGADKVAKMIKTKVVKAIELVGNAFQYAKSFIKVFGEQMDSARASLTNFLEAAIPAVEKALNVVQKINKGIEDTLFGGRSPTTFLLDQLPSLKYDPNLPEGAATRAIANGANNQPREQKVIIEVLADKYGMVTAMVNDPTYKNSVAEIVQKETKNAARSVGR